MARQALRPSEYTAALIQALRNERRVGCAARSVLEIGSGSGVVLAVARRARRGLAVRHRHRAGRRRRRQPAARRARPRQCRVPSRRHVAAGRRPPLRPDRRQPAELAASTQVPIAGRLPNWSAGGSDGRQLVDAFLDGLAAHLAPGGRALITHNAFIGLDRIARGRARATACRSMCACRSWSMSPEEKLALHDAEHRAGAKKGGRSTASARTRSARSTSSSSAQPGMSLPILRSPAAGFRGAAGHARRSAGRDAGRGAGGAAQGGAAALRPARPTASRRSCAASASGSACATTIRCSARARAARMSATSPTSPVPSPSVWASRSSSSASTPRRASRCWARIVSTWCWRPWGTPPSATASSASSGRITTSRKRRWSGPSCSGSATGTTSPPAPSASPSATARMPRWSSTTPASCCSTRRACCPTG